MYDGVCMIDKLQPVGIQLLQIPADYFFCPWWVLGLMLIAMFVFGMIFGIGTVIGWREFARKIRVLIYSWQMHLDQ